MSDPVAEAIAAGVLFYCHPKDLEPEQIDLLMRPVVEAINRSGWVWSAESCQGHPDATTSCWAENTRPMLRLVCRAEHEGAMLAALFSACRSMAVHEGDYENYAAWGRPGATALEIYPDERGAPNWCETLVYIPATTVCHRNRGIETFARFAHRINELKPDRPS